MFMVKWTSLTLSFGLILISLISRHTYYFGTQRTCLSSSLKSFEEDCYLNGSKEKGNERISQKLPITFSTDIRELFTISSY